MVSATFDVKITFGFYSALRQRRRGNIALMTTLPLTFDVKLKNVQMVLPPEFCALAASVSNIPTC